MSGTDGDPSPAAPVGPDRRRVLSAGAAGIFSLTLPPAAAHATGDQGQGGGLAAPTGVNAEPIGYVSGENTGAIRVTWNPVTGANGYSVGWATTQGGAYDLASVGNVTTYDLTGRVGTDTPHYIVVSATDGTTISLNSTEVTSSPVIATGGTVTPVSVGGSVAYVEHRFLTPGTYSGASAFRLNRTYQLDELIVAGGGGGGNGWDGAPGGGGGAGGFRLRTGVARTVTPGTPEVLTVVVGAGGAGGADDGASNARAGADGVASSLGDVTVAGGGGGGAARDAGRAGGSGGGAGGRQLVAAELRVDRAGGTATADGNPGGGSDDGSESGVGAGGGGGAAGGGSRPGDGDGGTTTGGGGGAGMVVALGGTAGAAVTFARGGDGGTIGDAATIGADATVVGGGGAGGVESDALGATAGGAGATGAVIVRYALPTAADPATPTGLSVVPAGRTGTGNGAIEVSWTAVPGATYTVEHRQQGVGADWTATTGIGGTSTVITGLDPALTYEARVTAVVGGVNSVNSDAASSGTVVATGGTVTTFTGNGAIGADGTTYVVHTFTSVATTSFVLNRSRDVEYLVVGGGGGGGARVGAGGGGGAMRTGTLEGLTGSTSVTVGAGGRGASASGASSSVVAGADGGDSILGAITADGGGRGASNVVVDPFGHAAGPSAGNTGASGGGGARNTAAGNGGAYGNDGGAGHEPGAGTSAAGGGGGAGGVGGAASQSTAGDGGVGATSTITGTSLVYAAGGGGSAQNTTAAGDGAGGSGIGGDGAGTPETAGAITAGQGTDGTGSGGGGSTSTVGANSGGAGGSGVVVVRYALPA